MAIAFQCSCGKKYSVKEALAGKKAKCQNCGNEMVVPAAGSDPLEDDGGLAPLDSTAADPLAMDPLSAPLGDMSLGSLGADPLAGGLAGATLGAPAQPGGGLQPAQPVATATSEGSIKFPMIMMVVGGIAAVVVLVVAGLMLRGMGRNKPSQQPIAAAPAAPPAPAAQTPATQTPAAATAAAAPAPNPAVPASPAAPQAAAPAAPPVDPNVPPPPAGAIEALEKKLAMPNLLEKVPMLQPVKAAGEASMGGGSSLAFADADNNLVLTIHMPGGSGMEGMAEAATATAETPLLGDPAMVAGGPMGTPPAGQPAAPAIPTLPGGMQLSPTTVITVAWKSEGLRGSFSGMHKSGQWQLAHPNGKTHVRGAYAGDKRHGSFVVSDDQGRWLWEGQYNQGKLVRSQNNPGKAEGDFTLFAAGGPIRQIATSPDGKLAVTVAATDVGSASSTADEVKLWDIATGGERSTLPHVGPVQHLQFAPDSKTLLTLEGKTAPRTSEYSDPTMEGMAAGGNSSAGPAKSRLWNVETGALLCEFTTDAPAAGDNHPFGPASVQTVHFSPQGNYLAATTRDGNQTRVKVWDAHTGQELYTLPDSEPGAMGGQIALQHTAFAFSPDESRLASLTAAGLRLWNSDKGNAAGAIPNAPAQPANNNSGMPEMVTETSEYNGMSSSAGQPAQLRFAPDGNTVFSVESSGVRKWNLEAKTAERLGASVPTGKRGVADVGPAAAALLQVSDADIALYDTAEGRQVYLEKGILKTAENTAPDWSLSPDWRFWAVTRPDDNSRPITSIYNVPTGELLKSLPNAQACVFSPKAPLLAVRDAKDEALLRVAHVLFQGETPLKLDLSPAIPPDEKKPADNQTAAASADPAVNPAPATGIDPATMPGQAGQPKPKASPTAHVAFSADGRWLIAGLPSGKVVFHDTAKLTQALAKPVADNKPPTLEPKAAPARLLAGTQAVFEFAGQDADGDPLLYAFRTGPDAPWQLDGDGKCVVHLPLSASMTLEVMASDGRGGRSPVFKTELPLAENIWARWQSVWKATPATETFQVIQYASRQRPNPGEMETESAYSYLSFTADGKTLVGHGAAPAGANSGSYETADAASFEGSGSSSGGAGSNAHVWFFQNRPKAIVFSTLPAIGGHGGFSTKGDTFYAGSAQGGLLTFDIGSTNFRAYDPPEKETEAATFAAASSAHGIVATAHSGPFVKIWKTSENKHFKTLKPNGPECGWLDFSKDGALLAAACGDSATVWNAEDWSELKRIDIPDCRRVFFDQTGKRLIALQDKQQRVSVWDIESATEITAIASASGEQGVWQALAVSPGDIVMAIASGPTIYLYRSADGQLLRTLSGHTGQVTDLVFRPDGLVLASVAADKTVQLWGTPEEGANLPPSEKFELPKPPIRRQPRNRSS